MFVRTLFYRRLAWLRVAAGLAAAFLTSANISWAKVDYTRDVRPIFEKHCYACHGPDQQESGLRLDVFSAALNGGDLSAPNILPGNAADSPLIQYVSPGGDLAMPPDGTRLADDEIAVLRRWIDEGAEWPDADSQGLNKKSRWANAHWSFQPIARAAPPKTEGDWASNDVDRFVLARLQEAGLQPSPAADRVTLIRRLYFDLHGLPPTPEDVRKFIRDDRPDAYEHLVERLLASPQYGQRWGQHWLDVARFAESHGFETNVERPNAWPYRDYVIESLNEDKPYNQFVAEQLAGDALGAPTATGFLVGGAFDQVKSPDIALTLMQRQDELADITNTTASALLGLTVGCARCHNHKFDPILQKDYFALQAIFAGVQHGERPYAPQAQQPADDSRLPPVSALKNDERVDPIQASAVRLIVTATNDGAEPCIDELEVWSAAPSGTPFRGDRNIALAVNGGRLSSSGDYADRSKHRLENVNDGKFGNDWSWISSTRGVGWVQIDFSTPAEIHRITWSRDRLGGFADRLATHYRIEVLTVDDRWVEVASSESRRPYLPEDAKVYAGVFAQPDQPTRRLFRGDPMAPKDVVAPGIPIIFGSLRLPADAPEQQRRLALAQWIGDPSNPLTARVMANRIWQYHFGVGLVDTPSDFGASGSNPTHPELLDWLATELVDNRWSLKHLHRVILSSSTYRQSSSPRQECMRTDANSRLLWRFPPRRLESEAIRDTILSVCGNLDLTAGGPGWRAFEPNENYVRVYEPKEVFGPAEWRRMVYMQRIRMRADGVFGAFDAPDGGQSCPRRGQSTTAIQALNLFNSRFMAEQSARLADRLVDEAGADVALQVELAFALAYNRDPTPEDVASAVALIRAYGLVAFCRAVLNSNELIFIP